MVNEISTGASAIFPVGELSIEMMLTGMCCPRWCSYDHHVSLPTERGWYLRPPYKLSIDPYMLCAGLLHCHVD